jgi:curli biogenesis system outer membrane secretion channel CsgG
MWNDSRTIRHARSLGVTLLLVATSSACATAMGGGNSAPEVAPLPEVELSSYSVPLADRPTLMIMDFDYSAVSSDLTTDERDGLGMLVQALRGDTSERDRSESNFGAGIADLILGQVLEAGQFRLLERSRLDALMAEQDLSASSRADASQTDQVETAKLLGAQYALVGAITSLGSQEESRGISGGRLTRGFGGVGQRSRNTVVELTARVVDTSTGEVLVSATVQGVSDQGGGFALGGGGRMAGLSFGSSQSNVRETAIGEATDHAVLHLVHELSDRWERLW